MVFFAYAAPSCGMFGTLIHFLWTDYNFHPRLVKFTLLALFFLMKFFWSLSFRTEILFFLCYQSLSPFVFSAKFKFRRKNFYSAAFFAPVLPLYPGVQEMFSRRSPLSARSPFRASSGSHAKCFLYEYSFFYTSIFLPFSSCYLLYPTKLTGFILRYYDKAQSIANITFWNFRISAQHFSPFFDTSLT